MKWYIFDQSASSFHFQRISMKDAEGKNKKRPDDENHDFTVSYLTKSKIFFKKLFDIFKLLYYTHV